MLLGKMFSGYLNYYLLTLKVVVMIIERAKLSNVRVILDIRAEVSIIILY